MDWEDEYKRKITTPEEAIKVVKGGDYVAFGYGTEPLALGLALLNRGMEVGGIKVFVPAPGRDFAWYDPGWEETFQVEVAHILPIAHNASTGSQIEGRFEVKLYTRPHSSS